MLDITNIWKKARENEREEVLKEISGIIYKELQVIRKETIISRICNCEGCREGRFCHYNSQTEAQAS